MNTARQKPKRPAKSTAPAAAVTGALQSSVWRKHALLIIALWISALAAYSNSFSGAFVFDNNIILQDSRIKALTSQNIDLILTREYWNEYAATGLYRPLTTFSYLFNYTILGQADHPAGYHWLNFALHGLNIAMVYLLGLVLFGEVWPAAAMAALWSLHPLLTESVTNIVGRADLLAAFGVVGGLLCHIRAACASGWRRVAWLAGLAVVTAIGYFSKESTVVILAAMLLYDLASGGIKSWRTRAPGYLATAVPLLVYLYMRSEVLSKLTAERIVYTDNPIYKAEFWTARLTAFKVIGKYLWLLVWPQTLSCDYSYNQIPLFGWTLSWEDMKAWIALAVCLGALALAIWSLRRQKLVFFFILFFFAALSPTANLVFPIGTIMAERFVYLPSIGYAGCLVVAIWALCQRLPVPWRDRRLAQAVAAAIALAFLVRTHIRNNDWQDEPSLWTKAIETSPHSFKTHMAFATAINKPSEEPTVDLSISEGQKALAILQPLPDSLKLEAPYVNAGMFYREKGILTRKKFSDPHDGERQAQTWYQKALERLLQAKAIEAAVQAEAREEGRWSDARVAQFGVWQLNAELGRTYLALNEPGKALELFRAGLLKQPRPEFYLDIASAYRASGDMRRSAVALMQGLVANPTQASLTSRLVDLYKQIDPGGCALQQVRGATSINLSCPMVHDDLCAGARDAAAYYASVNQPSKSIEVANTGMRDLGCSADLFK
jgi:hypothetical protein